MIQVICEAWLVMCGGALVQPVTNYPAVMVIYDPTIGGINCDEDCTTIATGPLLDEYWYQAGACYPNLLGAEIYFPVIDFTMKCVDNGGKVTVLWNEYYQQEVVYFDVLWSATNPPYWLYWLLDDWQVMWYND